MKASFDFESTADRKDVQEYIKFLKSKGVDVIITTARTPDSSNLTKAWNKDLYKTARQLNITEKNILFSPNSPKYQTLKGRGVAFHLDDDQCELEDMRVNSSIPAVSVLDGGWKDKCNTLLKL